MPLPGGCTIIFGTILGFLLAVRFRLPWNPPAAPPLDRSPEVLLNWNASVSAAEYWTSPNPKQTGVICTAAACPCAQFETEARCPDYRTYPNIICFSADPDGIFLSLRWDGPYCNRKCLLAYAFLIQNVPWESRAKLKFQVGSRPFDIMTNETAGYAEPAWLNGTAEHHGQITLDLRFSSPPDGLLPSAFYIYAALLVRIR